MKKLTLICLVFCLITTVSFASIHQAATDGDLEQVKSLLADNHDLIKSRDSAGKVALHHAAYNGHDAVVSHLLDEGADINARSNQNSTPLHGAAFYGHDNTVKLLIGRGIDVNLANSYGYTPLLSASAGGHLEIVKMLIAAGADKSAKVTASNIGALLASAASGNNELVDYLISEGFDINAKDIDGEGLLHYSAYGGNLDLVKKLVNDGIDVNVKSAQEVIPLQYAAMGIHEDVVKHLIEKGSNVNTKDIEGETPIHEVIMNAYRDTTDAAFEIVKILVDNGADVNAKTNRGVAPLHWSVYRDNADIVSYLIKSGADLNAINDNGLSPLHEAVTRNKYEYINLLVKSGAKNDLKDNHYGFTPLHRAALKGNIDVVRDILPAVDNINTKCNDGHTAIYYAAKYGHEQVAELLKANGAKEKGLVENYGYSKLLRENLEEKEAALWYLGHCGWAIKTKNQFLIFDYWERGTDLAQPSLANGHILPDEIKDQNVKVFATHEHQDHYDSSIFTWQEPVENLTYIFGFHPEDLVEDSRMGYNGQKYEYVDFHETKTIDGIEITPIRANDAGQGFLVKVDGFTIYHAGDHAGWRDNQREGFTSEIDFLIDKTDELDFAFVNVTGCHTGDTLCLAEGTFYTIEKLAPKIIVPTHALDREYVYKEYADKIHAKYPDAEVLCPEHRGDSYMHKTIRQ
ncbi:MAG: hypothetical protein GY839_08645 [candidate division Zixibacteria bacterium]|nr:hypothetical protein [candidate division Zixibacteria bacterium]